MAADARCDVATMHFSSGVFSLIEPYWVHSLFFITQILGQEKSFANGAMDYVYRRSHRCIKRILLSIIMSEVDANISLRGNK